MRLITRQEIHEEFRFPIGTIDERMKELGVLPYPPSRRGRGHHLLYDAEEIVVALRNEREVKQAKKQKRVPRLHKKNEGNIYEMGWKKASQILTVNSCAQ